MGAWVLVRLTSSVIEDLADIYMCRGLGLHLLLQGFRPHKIFGVQGVRRPADKDPKVLLRNKKGPNGNQYMNIDIAYIGFMVPYKVSGTLGSNLSHLRLRSQGLQNSKATREVLHSFEAKSQIPKLTSIASDRVVQDFHPQR